MNRWRFNCLWLLGGLALAAAYLSQAGAATAKPLAPAAALAPAAQAGCEDIFESDDVYTQAVTITVNSPAQVHTFHDAYDDDWVVFSMTAGKRYAISTSSLISKTDTILYLYGADGSTLLATHDDIYWPDNPASQIITTAVQSGVYYARVRSYNGAGGCPDYGYDLAVTAGGPTYLPIIAKASSVAISGLEVTQSVQDSSNSVSLVAGRRTVVRVYVFARDGQAVSNVNVRVSAARNGSPLAGSPLVIGPQAAPVSPSRASLASTFNVELPTGWLSGQVTLTATAYVGSNYIVNGDNTAVMTLNFNVVPTLNVMVVPIQYTHTPTGYTYPAPSASDLGDWIMRAYPVSTENVTVHAARSFAGNLHLSTDWENLLWDITNLHTTEVGFNSPVVYYGLIPTHDGTLTWFSGGYSGLGWVGMTRASIGLDLDSDWPGGADAAGITAAHEVGHNLGRGHAPCGGASEPDPNYPYVGGSIGQFGLDIVKWVLWNPATTYDLMGYCDPEWVSDYTYQGLYTNQVAHGAQIVSAPEAGLLVRATFDSQSQPVLQPVYVLNTTLTEAPAPGDYTVELLGAGGKMLASYPVVLLTADEPGISARAIVAVVPQPAVPVASLRLVDAGGQTVAERNLTAAVLPAAAPTVTRGASGLTLHWGAAGVPAVVRFTADDGQTWTTLGLDVLAGELQIDPATLPAGGGRFEILLADTASGGSIEVSWTP